MGEANGTAGGTNEVGLWANSLGVCQLCLGIAGSAAGSHSSGPSSAGGFPGASPGLAAQASPGSPGGSATGWPNDWIGPAASSHAG